MALDLFGDLDTCRAAQAWQPVGTPQALQIDGPTLLDALHVLARCGRAIGWVAGAGFEGRPDLLEAGAALLPLFGTAGPEVRRLRDPATFFPFLRARGLRFPAVRPLQAADPAGWLTKDSGGCGGWHITRAPERAQASASGQRYQQREARGVPMSATFIANGRDAVVLGCNEQLVAPLGERPHVYRGVLGPLPLDASVTREVATIVHACAESFALRGLASLDFLLDGERVLVLEVNPRPPASLALYPRVGNVGVLQAHLDACIDARLPPARPGVGLPADAASVEGAAIVAGSDTTAATARVHGNEIIYAPVALAIDPAAALQLAHRPGTHDLPRAATRFAAGDPICSVSAEGATAAAVKAELAQRRDVLLRWLVAVQPRSPDPIPLRLLETSA